MADGRVIDADGHVWEPEEMWPDYLEEPYRKRSPKVVWDNRGTERYMVEGRLCPKPSGFGRGATEGWAASHLRPGGADPRLRLEDMDAEGIDIAVLFGSLSISAVCGIEDLDFAVAFSRAYNNWLADYCKAAPERLKGVACLPLQDVPAAIAEAQRAVRDLNMISVTVPTNVQGVNLNHTKFTPFYAAIQDLGVPLSLHGVPFYYNPAAGIDRFDVFFLTHSVAHPFEQMIAVASMVCGGVLDRFPDLRVSFLESGIGWVPYWMERLDAEFEFRPEEVPIKRPPSEYMKSEQCFYSCDPDEKTIPYVAEVLGEDRIIFASDYPHWDSRFPHSVSDVHEVAGLSERVRNKIFGENAARLYGL